VAEWLVQIVSFEKGIDCMLIGIFGTILMLVGSNN
jgi:hypothetical protein